MAHIYAFTVFVSSSVFVSTLVCIIISVSLAPFVSPLRVCVCVCVSLSLSVYYLCVCVCCVCVSVYVCAFVCVLGVGVWVDGCL